MIRFDNVTYTYPFQNRPAVKNINFAVKPGEAVVCTGESGCGKSTLVRLANGLCPHYYHGTLDGQVLIDGGATSSQSLPHIARLAGTLFQDPEQQFFALGVEDELVFALEWQGTSISDMKAKVEQATSEFDLNQILHSQLETLSEGQKQKVGLASIWMQKPRALILDEPTANLDPEATAALAETLRQLKKQGIAIFIVDHRLYWLKDLADHVLIMQKGRIRREGSFAMLQNPAVIQEYGLRQPDICDTRTILPACPSNGNGIVSVTGLSFSYKNAMPVYRNASFSLPQGICALIGDNGTGKTTLARILAGLNREQGGSIRIHGKKADHRQRIAATGIVLQNADHQLHMRTVREEIAICLRLSKRHDLERVDKLLGTFDLLHVADRHPQSLSGGEKQRLVIAAALAKNPDILILDEPTSGLDGANMARLANALKKEADMGRCILIITHDLELLQLIGPYALRVPFNLSAENAENTKGERHVA